MFEKMRRWFWDLGHDLYVEGVCVHILLKEVLFIECQIM